MTDKVSPALVGKAGEMLVAAELMRKGIEIAHPASDVGVDLLAYRLQAKQKVATKFVPVQVKTRSETGYAFLRSWFDRCPGVAPGPFSSDYAVPRASSWSKLTALV
jgi:hypothetical protein